MTGPDHCRKAEELAAKAEEFLGQGAWQENAAGWAVIAQIHATLAQAAVSALGTRAPDGRDWAEIGGAKY